MRVRSDRRSCRERTTAQRESQNKADASCCQETVLLRQIFPHVYNPEGRRYSISANKLRGISVHFKRGPNSFEQCIRCGIQCRLPTCTAGSFHTLMHSSWLCLERWVQSIRFQCIRTLSAPSTILLRITASHLGEFMIQYKLLLRSWLVQTK